jgi:hypothetical protein
MTPLLICGNLPGMKQMFLGTFDRPEELVCGNATRTANVAG